MRVATEAAMKYFVLGALASGFLLYGLSMMYGATGSLRHPAVFNAIATGQHQQGRCWSSASSSSSPGLAFKLGAVPFHMWVPDVYQGAPTAVTLLIAGAPKLAAFAITIRLLVDGMFGLAGRLAADAASCWRWSRWRSATSPPSRRRNLKRMLAYSGHRADGFHAARRCRRCRQRQHAVGRQRLQLGDVLHREPTSSRRWAPSAW